MSESNRYLHDQAATLRMLVKRAAGSHAGRRSAPRPWQAVFIGPGDGETAPRWCLEVATRFSRQGLRTVVIDADLRNPSLHTLCGLPATGGLASWLADDVSLHEALVRGPEGLLVLTGGEADAADWLPDDASLAASLLDLDALGPYADAIFAAIGGSATPLSANLVRSARVVAATFEAGDEAILGTYASMKRHAASLVGKMPTLIADEEDADARDDAARRVARSLSEFLKLGSTIVEPPDGDAASRYEAAFEELFRMAESDRAADADVREVG
ncbi:MAG TPA: hypothetical protein VGN57_01235 [Pirellulaceae bacterium]|jgi:hypothetical protein|nr:hypothetical protein [Pirellulaceae bacterium]